MKDEPKFKEYMAALCELHDKSLSQLLINLYWKTLEPFTDNDCERAFKELIFSSKVFPKPVDFIETLKGKKQDQGTLAWLTVVKALRKIGPYQSVTFDDPVIHSIIEAMGGWIKLGTVTEDELKWKQREFERLYSIISGKGGNHPTYLPGITERDNAANGYSEHIPAPVRIGFEKHLELVA